MGKGVIGELGEQDLFYGFRPESVVKRLTRGNYRKKALLRKKGEELIYIFICRGVTSDGGIERAVFCVKTEGLQGKPSGYGVDFDNLAAALRYANCEDGGGLAVETVPCGESDIPEERPPQAFAFVPFCRIREDHRGQ